MLSRASPQDPSNSLIVETPLGLVRFWADVEASTAAECQLEFRIAEFQPDLPPGMSVRRARAVVLRIRATRALDRLCFRCSLRGEADARPRPTEPTPEPGARLDAQSWTANRDIVVIGTEDGEALTARLPWLRTPDDPLAFVRYEPDGLSIPLEWIPAGVEATLHHVVVENTYPEPVECCSWFAADLPHRRVLTL